MKNKKILITLILVTIIILPIKVNAKIPLIIDCQMEDELQNKVLCTISYEENGEIVPDEVILEIVGVEFNMPYFKFQVSDNWEITNSYLSKDYYINLRKNTDFKNNIIGTYECILTETSGANINTSLWIYLKDTNGTMLNEGVPYNIYPNIFDTASEQMLIGYEELKEHDEENNIATYSVNVPNNISKLILGISPKSENTISMILDMYMWLEFADVSVNDNLIDKSNLLTKLENLKESTCTFDNYDCTLYKDDYDKQFIYILKDNDSVSYYRYVDFTDLIEGTNNIKFDMGGFATYNFIINRELAPIENTTTSDDNNSITENTIEEVNDNNIINTISKELDNVIKNPDTGIAISIILSIISIILVGILYIKYYRKKKSTI